jgi:hypothetical protein
MREPASRTRRTRSASCRGPVEDAHRQLRHRDAAGLRDVRQRGLDGGGQVDDVREVAGTGDLLHVDAGARVEHRVPLGDRHDGQGVGQALGGQRGAVHGVDGEVDLRAGAVADVLAVVEHRRFVLLALADDDGAAHGDRVEHRPHGVDGGLVHDLLVAASRGGGRRRAPRLRWHGRARARGCGRSSAGRVRRAWGCRSLAVHLPCGRRGAQLLDRAGARGRPCTRVDTSGLECPAGNRPVRNSPARVRPQARARDRSSRAWPRARARGCARR